uniref:Uncharacterized protein n=1 Tax=Wuchereria bancrofti TaxID=6293 RepID=A0AAF5PNG8_WUCBA
MAVAISNGIRYFYALLPSERRPSVLLLAVGCCCCCC